MNQEILKAKLEDICFVVIDVETTGLRPEEGHRICEVAAVKFNGAEITERFESLINPERNIPEDAKRINNITDADVASAPLFKEIAPKLLAFIGSHPLAGYNIPFDLSFLNSSLRRAEFQTLSNPGIDVCELSRKLFKGPKSYSLENVAAYLGLSNTKFHRAMGDVEATCGILEKILQELKKAGIKTLGEAVVLSAK